jgi:hypothetical protein
VWASVLVPRLAQVWVLELVLVWASVLELVLVWASVLELVLVWASVLVPACLKPT